MQRRSLFLIGILTFLGIVILTGMVIFLRYRSAVPSFEDSRRIQTSQPSVLKRAAPFKPLEEQPRASPLPTGEAPVSPEIPFIPFSS